MRFMNAVQAMATNNGTGDTGSGLAAPVFPGGNSVTVMVAENTPSTGYVGGPVMASSTSVLTYELAGTHIGRFELAPQSDDAKYDEYYFDAAAELVPPVDDDRNTGPAQIVVKPVTHLDKEAGINYSVEITATDSEGQRATAMVTIVVEDVNEAPSKPRGFSAAAMPPNNPPAFGEGSSATRMVYENTAAGMDIGDPVTAADTDRGDEELTYAIGGADMASFDIDTATGQLMTKAALDFEMKSEYMVDVTAMDDEEAEATISVTISVMDVMLGEPGDTYDTDSNEMISRSEVIEAIRDFLFAQTITKEQVIDVIRLYLTE